ncbi:sugar ABC transporter substrate-binding protein [Amycolatopsis panacis]|uniref:sugar ABC transporter substrate-binding protein n=1 Tax=Amycolatopsis panacis TaxID=2340917 RepID=UPI001314408E|nr:substrate-binding domain-containing protein [Amycolatopsis panacis]
MPALFLTACGGSNGGSDASASDTTACVAKATEQKKTKTDPVQPHLRGALDLSKVKGKNIWIVNAARVPFLQQISDGAAAAAKAAGMTTKAVYGDGTTASAQSAVEQAIAQKADGIILVVVDPATIERAVKNAHDAGIVVTDAINRNVGAALPAGISGTASVDLTGDLKALTGWIMKDSGCKADTLMYSPSSLPITVESAKLFEKEYKALCPACKFEVKDLDYGKFASTLTSEVQTDVRRNPSLTHIFSIVGSTVPYVQAGLRSSGSHVHLATSDGLADNIEALRKKAGNLYSDFAFPPTPSLGWQLIDQQARLLQGDSSAKDIVLPQRLLDRDNVGQTEVEAWPAYADFESAYQKAWRG